MIDALCEMRNNVVCAQHWHMEVIAHDFPSRWARLSSAPVRSRFLDIKANLAQDGIALKQVLYLRLLCHPNRITRRTQSSRFVEDRLVALLEGVNALDERDLAEISSSPAR
jgi:hypothetical protein